MHLTLQELQEYANRTLAPTALLAADTHLMECGECRENLQSVLKASTGTTGLPAFRNGSWQPPLKNFTSVSSRSLVFLAASLDDVEQEIVTSHLPFCNSCQAEVDDLRAFQQLLAQPQARAAAATARQTPVAPARFWTTGKTAFSVVIALGLTIVGVLLYHKPAAEPVAQQTAAPQPTASLSPSPQPAASPRATPTPMSPEEQAIQQAMATGHVEIAAESKRLQRRGASLLGGKGENLSFAVVSPQGTLVESLQPQLHWTPLPQAQAYVVIVTDQNFKEVAHSGPLTQTNWSVTGKLTRGQLYQWQVTATTEDGTEITAPAPSAPEAQFKVLAQEPLNALQRARAQYAGGHLELGILYARVGLLDAAAAEFARESARKPLAHRLQQSLAQQRR
ncbi:MAG: hypothetical protein U0Y68_01155 [Blastocatellia bacterium]